MKILNLYAGIGGNRKLWGNEHKITAIEWNDKIAKIYQEFFPNDRVIVADAHKFLLEHYKEFDFIWSSPPCPTHSRIREAGAKNEQYDVVYPSMGLYQEIILLDRFFKGMWVVENVVPYYKPLIKAIEVCRHLFWSNFLISKIKLRSDNINKGSMEQFRTQTGMDLRKYKTTNERQLLRNMVNPELGLHVFNCAFKYKQKTLENLIKGEKK